MGGGTSLAQLGGMLTSKFTKMFLVLSVLFSISPAYASIMGRRAALGSLAAFLGSVGTGTPAAGDLNREKSGSTLSDFTPQFKTWRLNEIPRDYNVLSGAEASDDHLFDFAARSDHASEVRQLREHYRRAILNGEDITLKDTPRLTGLRTRAKLDPAGQDKWRSHRAQQILDIEEALAKDFNADAWSTATSAAIALSPEKMAAAALNGNLAGNDRTALYSRTFLRHLINRLFAVSPPLALRAAESSRVKFKEVRGWYLKELGLREFPGWTRQYFRFVFAESPAIYDLELHATEEQATAEAMAGHYLAALQKLAVAKAALNKVDPSPLAKLNRQAANELENEMRFELQTLRSRILAWRSQSDSPEWASRDWWTFETSPGSLIKTAVTTAQWVRMLNATIFGAGLLVPLLSQTAETAPEPVADSANVASEECAVHLIAAPVQEDQIVPSLLDAELGAIREESLIR